jgi:predicted Zn-dependent protease
MRAVYEMEDRTPDADLIDRIKGQLKKQGVATDSNPANNTIDVDSFTTEELRGEIELGRKMAAQILGFNEPISNEKIQGYVNALTVALAQLGLKTERPFRVSVLNSEQINAFACPGGYIFITQGALRATQSEAQLAAILGHEIVHVSKRHLLSSLKNKVAKKTPQKTQENIHQKNRLRIKPDDKAKSAQWAQILGPKGVGLTLLQASSEAIETLLSKGLEQEFELEADALGSQITSASGYNANRFVELLAKMQSRKEASADRTSTTHPAYSLRIEKLVGLVSSSSPKQSTGLDSTSLYSEMQKEWQNP